MRKRVLDTSCLIRQWREKASGRLGSKTEADAETWASELVRLHDSDAIVTPVYIEFVAGTKSAHELKLARVYLANFQIVDKGRILKRDWQAAQALAERIPKNSKPRHFGDCLIKAIANRLNYEVFTLDLSMPR